MKYEIIKGSAKDFQSEPEDVLVIFSVDNIDGIFRSACPSVDDLPKGWHLIAERRPITEPVWSGAGLPPVGVECEVKRALDWMKCKILFISDHHVVLTSEEEICWQTQACQFRPIRSSEDVARDEAKGIIAELCRSSASNGHSADLIYDAIAAGKIPGVKLEDK